MGIVKVFEIPETSWWPDLNGDPRVVTWPPSELETYRMTYDELSLWRVSQSLISSQPRVGRHGAYYITLLQKNIKRYATLQDTFICIQKPFAFSPQLFSKTKETINAVFKSVSPVNNAEILSFFLWARKNTLKTRVLWNKTFWNNGGEARMCVKIRTLRTYSDPLYPHFTLQKNMKRLTRSQIRY